MEQVAALMLLVGCSGDIAVCEQKPVPQPVFASVAECQEQIPLQMRLADSTQSKMFGACKQVNRTIVQETGSVDWAVSQTGQLVINVDSEPQRVASR